MVFLTLTSYNGSDLKAVWSPLPEAAEPLLDAETDCIAVGWKKPDALPLLLQLAESGRRLLVPEIWQEALPQAELLVSSAMSGGDLKQRFRQLPGHRCWLRLEPMRMAFPLPCPDGQGTVITDLPESSGFYAEALGCRYIHAPGQVILFDTEETMEQKILLAKACGFQGFVQIPEVSP